MTIDHHNEQNFNDATVTCGGTRGGEFGLASLRDEPNTYALVQILNGEEIPVDIGLRITIDLSRRGEELPYDWDERVLDLLVDHMEHNARRKPQNT